mgnify:CR=1 FL=1
MNREEKIMKRVQEHYDYLQSLGYEIVCVCLQGSQNYGLDEDSDDYQSDIDTKAIVLPPLDDFIAAASPVSTVVIMDNNEHAEVKDIRVMFDMFKKANISYIELLYTDFKIINPEWAELIEPLFANRARISNYHRNQFLRCIAGMAMEKRKALCHPYPNLIEKIEKWGYDGKQLHHCVRLYNFITRFLNGESLDTCYKVGIPMHNILMNYKKQKDAYGDPMSKERAIKICDYYVAEIGRIKDAAITEEEVLDKDAEKQLSRILLKIIKAKIIKDLEVNHD